MGVRDLPSAIHACAAQWGMQPIKLARDGACLGNFLNVSPTQIASTALLGFQVAHARILLVQWVDGFEPLDGFDPPRHPLEPCVSADHFKLSYPVAERSAEAHFLARVLGFSPIKSDAGCGIESTRDAQLFGRPADPFGCIELRSLGSSSPNLGMISPAASALGFSVRVSALAPIRAAARDLQHSWRDVGQFFSPMGSGDAIELRTPAGVRVWVYRLFAERSS